MKSLVLALTLCLMSMPQYAQDQTITIGTSPHNPPFSSLADNKDHFYGFDIDIMGEICQRLKAECRFTPLIFSNIVTKLRAGEITVAIAAIIITEHEEQEFLFSLPYLESNAQFVTNLQSNIDYPKGITNKRIGVRLGTPFARLALKIYSGHVQIVPYPDIPHLFEGLQNNDADVILVNDKAARYWCANTSAFCKLIGSKIPVGNGYGIMTTRDQGPLLARINQALLSMEADGKYLEIYSRYFDD